MDSNNNTSYFKIDKKDEAHKLSWLESKLKYLRDDSNSATQAQLEFIRAYANADANGTIGTVQQALGMRKRDSVTKARTPFIYDLTESKVAQMSRLKADIRVIPRHSEYNDRQAAKASHMVIKNIQEQNQFDSLMVDLERLKIILGEVYLIVDWNKDKGDLDPLYVELSNSDVTSVQLPDGKTISLKEPVRIGEVDYKIGLPWDIFVEERMSAEYCDARYAFRREYVDPDELEHDYPKAKGKISSSEFTNNNFENMVRTAFEAEKSEVAVYHFYHKKTKYLPNGKYIKFIEGCILEETDLPYEHGDFPWERYVDIRVKGYQRGVSRYYHVLPMQKRLDDLNLACDINNYKAALGKWFYQQGSTTADALNGVSQYVPINSSVMPQYATVTPSSPQLYQRVEKLQMDMNTIFGTTGISKDTIPAGVTAYSAIQLVNQLESERATPDIQERATFVVAVSRKSLSLAGQFYNIDDGRLARIVGKNNEYTIKNFDQADLNKPYDIKFENSDGFPESEAGKQQRLQQYAQQLPDIMSGAEWVHYLGINDEQGAIDMVTEAIKCAESENEDLQSGNFVADPDETEDLITHHKIHLGLFQRRSFKEESSNEAFQAAKDHLFKTEVCMLMKAQNNPHYQAQLAQVPNFPVFPHPEFSTPMSKEQAEMIVSGQANRGEEITAMIPSNPNFKLKGE